jgi:hypothetical protein
MEKQKSKPMKLSNLQKLEEKILTGEIILKN